MLDIESYWLSIQLTYNLSKIKLDSVSSKIVFLEKGMMRNEDNAMKSKTTLFIFFYINFFYLSLFIVLRTFIMT